MLAKNLQFQAALNMSRKRLDSGNEVELSVGALQSGSKSSNVSNTQKSKTSLKERYQSIGLIAMVICFIIIGFQMTTNDAYSRVQIDDNVINLDKPIDTPSPTHHQIEVMIHEDDGDVEVDVPDQLPPDLRPNQLINPLQHGTTLTIRRTQTNNNDSSLSIYIIIIHQNHT